MRIMDLLNALEPAERDLVVLRFVEGFSYEELSLGTQAAAGTVKWRIFNARKKLSRTLSYLAGTRNAIQNQLARDRFMKHGISELEWSDYVDGSATAEVRDRIEAHFIGCLQCWDVLRTNVWCDRRVS